MTPTDESRLDTLLRLRKQVWFDYPEADARVMFWALSNAIDTIFFNVHPNTTAELIGALDNAE